MEEDEPVKVRDIVRRFSRMQTTSSINIRDPDSQLSKMSSAQVAVEFGGTLKRRKSTQLSQTEKKRPILQPKPQIEPILFGKSSRDESSTSLDSKHNKFPNLEEMGAHSLQCSDETNEKTPISPLIQTKLTPLDLWEPSEMSESLRKSTKGKIVTMFDNLMMILESEEFDKSLRDCLERANPMYMESVLKRKKDILKLDHGIVIAGETSAGKTTLINKLLGMNLFKSRNRESTSTVCKIRNSEKVIIKQESETGMVKQEELLDIDITVKNDVKLLRKTLKGLTDMTVDKHSKKFRSVDISLPVPFLKGNTIMVDTPGIGGSGQVSQKLMEYLPNAVSFIFVINAASAGGMQRDRLPGILESIKDLMLEDEMPCFDPSSVIFITNKWDSIPNEVDDTSDEDEKTETLKSITSTIHNLWPFVRDENIFKMSLKEVHVPHRYQFGEEAHSNREFEKFRQTLENVIKENENIRIKQHLRYLRGLLLDTYMGVRSRQELTKKSKSEQEKKRQDHEMRIIELKEKCSKNGAKWRDRIKTFMEEQASKSLEYMSSDFGKERILNPKSRREIMEVHINKVGKKVNSRVDLYISEIVRDPEVVAEFKCIKNEIMEFYKEFSIEMEQMENEWKNASLQTVVNVLSTEEEYVAPYVAGVIATSPLWFPLLTVAVAIGIVTLPITGAVVAIMTTDANKQKKIDKKYEKCKSTIRSKVYNTLESSYGNELTKLIAKVTCDMLEKRIKFIEETIKELCNNRETIIAKQECLNRIAEKLEHIKNMSEEIAHDSSSC